MHRFNISKYPSFYVVGVSHRTADEEIRGKFSLTPASRKLLLSEAKAESLDGLLALSTCNRTELYGFADHPYQLIKLLCNHSKGNIELFEQKGYVLKNYAGIDHLFRVGTGLDSQILGDFEIIGQIKSSFSLSSSLGISSPFIERLCNAVIRASKKVKTETAISSGAASVSFTAVRYIMRKVPDVSKKNILLFGLGKIGRNTCENLVKHTGHQHITLINRTLAKAQNIAGRFTLQAKPFDVLGDEIEKTDVLIVATAGQTPIITPRLVNIKKPLLILDLSVPKNVDSKLNSHPLVTLLHLDCLSRMADETLEKRKKEVPAAEKIIASVKEEFVAWLETRRFAPTIKALKEKLTLIKESELRRRKKKNGTLYSEEGHEISDRVIHKITSHFANYLKEANGDSAESLALIQKIFELEVPAS